MLWPAGVRLARAGVNQGVHRRPRHRRHGPRADRQRHASWCGDGRIVAVSRPAVTIPAGAERVSLAGKTVIPGLVNAHGHVGNTVGLEQGATPPRTCCSDLRTYAAYGVTTVFSLGDDQAAGFTARDAQRDARASIARACYVAGPVLAPKSPDEARKLVAEDAAMKVDIVKIRVDDNLGTTPEDGARGLSRGHRRGAQAKASRRRHTSSTSPTPRRVLDAGPTTSRTASATPDVDADASSAMLKQPKRAA